jgi:hypothetical protein
MLERTLAFVSALLGATRSGALTWRISANDDRDLFEAFVDDESISVEILYLPALSGSERAEA